VIAGILTAIYYGYLSEKIGCRAILGIATGGYSLMLAWIVLVCPSMPPALLNVCLNLSADLLR
jgi:hypothetical protein